MAVHALPSHGSGDGGAVPAAAAHRFPLLPASNSGSRSFPVLTMPSNYRLPLIMVMKLESGNGDGDGKFSKTRGPGWSTVLPTRAFTAST